MLRAAGDTVRGPRPTDSLSLFVDQQGDLVVLLLDLQTPLADSDLLGSSLMSEAREALDKHAALHSVVGALEMQLGARPGVEVGLLVLRVSQRDARVELLNAGMPPVASAGPGERVSVHPALSDALGRRVGDVHPYELVPLAWGSTWLAVSDGALNGSFDPEGVRVLCSQLGLTEGDLPLSTAASVGQYDAFRALLPAAPFRRDDATLVLVSADPQMRFKSGIV